MCLRVELLEGKNKDKKQEDLEKLRIVENNRFEDGKIACFETAENGLQFTP